MCERASECVRESVCVCSRASVGLYHFCNHCIILWPPSLISVSPSLLFLRSAMPFLSFSFLFCLHTFFFLFFFCLHTFFFFCLHTFFFFFSVFIPFFLSFFNFLSVFILFTYLCVNVTGRMCACMCWMCALWV